MRIRTITGLAFAGIAAAGAAVVGGAAYAGGDEDGTTAVVRIVTEDESTRTDTRYSGTRGSAAYGDCPEKNGSDRGESGAPTTPDQPATPDQPTTPDEPATQGDAL